MGRSNRTVRAGPPVNDLVMRAGKGEANGLRKENSHCSPRGPTNLRRFVLTQTRMSKMIRNTWGPREANSRLQPVGGWHDPAATEAAAEVPYSPAA